MRTKLQIACWGPDQGGGIHWKEHALLESLEFHHGLHRVERLR